MFHLLSIHETFDADVINHEINKLRCGIFEFYEQFPLHGLVNFTMTNIVYCMGGDTFTRRFSLKPLLKHLSVSSSQVFGGCLSYPFSFGFCFQLVLHDLGLALVAHSLALHHHKFFGLSAAELATGQMPPPPATKHLQPAT
jgi:hypothetical protein